MSSLGSIGSPPCQCSASQAMPRSIRSSPGDLAGREAVQELWVQAGEATLEPSAIRKLIPNFELYAAHARAAMGIFGSDEKEPTERYKDLVDSAQPLRDFGRPGRGLTDEFYKRIGQHYNALVAEGERYPVKTLAGHHHASTSAASRWVKEARNRKYIPARGGKEADDARPRP